VRCEMERAAIDYESFGSGIPLVVLHGMPLDRHASMHEFEPILSARAGWRRIYPDLPGHGRSPAAARITTPDELLSVLAEFVTATLGDARFVLAGTSFGACLAAGSSTSSVTGSTGCASTSPPSCAIPRGPARGA